MKWTRIFTTAKLLLAILVFAALTQGVATAQEAFKGTFQLNEEARWMGKTLPPGTYNVTIESVNRPIIAVVRSSEGKIFAMAVTNIAGDAVSKQNSMFISGTGKGRKVSALNLPLLGISLEYAPMTDMEREYLSKGKTGAVAVDIASR